MSDPRVPQDVATTTAILRHFSWAPLAKVPGKYEVWGPLDRSEELLLPLDPDSGDFSTLLERARRYTERRFGSDFKRAEQLLSLRSAAALDSARWTKETTVDAGLIPWAEGEALFSAARESLTSSARAVYSRRLHHGRSGSYLARNFIHNTFMGQTEVGSFVVTAHTPSNERFHVRQASANLSPDEWRKAEQVSGRTIMQAFQTAVEAVRSGLDEYKKAPTTDTFVPLVEEGVSFEFVSALTALTTGGDASIKVEYFASGTQQTAPVEVTFDAAESQVLARVAERFAEVPKPQKVTVTGEVSLLDNSTTSPVHLVRLDVMTGAEVRRARVRLSPEQYELAVQAHFEHKWLTVAGTLEKDGRDYWLYNVGDVRLALQGQGPSAWPVFLFGEDEEEDEDTV